MGLLNNYGILNSLGYFRQVNSFLWAMVEYTLFNE